MQRLLTLAQVRARFPVAPSRIYELLNAGLFPLPLKIGRRSLWLEADIDEWLTGLAEKRDILDHMGKPVPVLPAMRRDELPARSQPARRKRGRPVTDKEITSARRAAGSG